MKILKSSFLAFLLLAAIQSASFSQVKFLLGPTVGVTIPSGDYTGTTLDFYNGAGYGLSGGLSVGGVLKARFTSINLKVLFNYSTLSNSGSATSSSGFITNKQNIFMVGVGPEFGFGVGKSPVKPYLGVNLLLSSFGGEVTFEGVPRVPSGTYAMSTTTRTGLGLDVGTEISFAGKYALDVNLQYSFLNLLGKSFNGGDSRLASYTSLNDANDPLFATDPNDHPVSGSRTITTLQLSLGFLFGF